jgi:hypothetical protein
MSNLDFNTKCAIFPQRWVDCRGMSGSAQIPGCNSIVYVPANYPTIQSAVNGVAGRASVATPQVVAICPGLYVEDVTLVDNVHLAAASGSNFINSEGLSSITTIQGTVFAISDGNSPIVSSVTNITLQGPIQVLHEDSRLEIINSKIGLNTTTGLGGIESHGIVSVRNCVGDTENGEVTHRIVPNGTGALLRWNGFEIGQVQGGTFSPHVFRLEGGDVSGLARLDLFNSRVRGRFETVLQAGNTDPQNAIVIESCSLRWLDANATGLKMFELQTSTGATRDALLFATASVDQNVATAPLPIVNVTGGGGTLPLVDIINTGFDVVDNTTLQVGVFPATVALLLHRTGPFPTTGASYGGLIS